MHVIYGLEDQRTSEIFYVGVTDDIQSRFLQHLRCDGSNPLKDHRIGEMRTAGYLPSMRTLQLVLGEQAAKREAYWIRHYYDLGSPLTNQVIPVKPEHVTIVQRDRRGYERWQESKKRHILRPTMSSEKRQEMIISMQSSGKSHRDIAKAVGLSGRKYGTYQQVCRELGFVTEKAEGE